MILGELYKLKARKTIVRTLKTVINQIIILLGRNIPIILTSIMPFIRQMVIIPRTVTPLNWFAITILALVPLLNPLICPTTTSIGRNRSLVGKPLVGKILILITSLIRELL